jgi:hypothetical protein
VTDEVMSNDVLDYAREHPEARLPTRGGERATTMTYEQSLQDRYGGGHSPYVGD